MAPPQTKKEAYYACRSTSSQNSNLGSFDPYNDSIVTDGIYEGQVDHVGQANNTQDQTKCFKVEPKLTKSNRDRSRQHSGSSFNFGSNHSLNNIVLQNDNLNT